MPWTRSLYPPDWEAIALEVKERSDWKCEGCGKPCRRPGQTFFDFAYPYLESGEMGQDDLDHPQRFTLTVAHLNHKPDDCRPENLRTLCAPCHCRMDLKARGTKQRLNRERQGQLSLLQENENV